jgi:hypothetical protein
MQTPVEEAQAAILAHLGMTEKESRPAHAPEELARFAGRYQAEPGVPITNPLVVTLKGDRLWVNSYWPNGCPLIDEGEGQFRLENTSHRIRFETQPDGSVGALTYLSGGKHYHYQRV